MSSLVIATILTTQIPELAVERTWGRLLQAQHHRGTWSVEVGDRRLTGDWIVEDDGRLQLLDLRGERASSTRCVVQADRMHCDTQPTSSELYNLTLAEPVALARSTIALDRWECPKGSCRRVHAGRLVIATREITPTVAQAEQVFARVHRMSLERAIGAPLVPTHSLVLKLPYRIETPIGGHAGRFAREVIEAEATIAFERTKPRITAREVARYVEDCEQSAHAASSCMPKPPLCTRRR
jgi:hypothetical protein